MRSVSATWNMKARKREMIGDACEHVRVLKRESRILGRKGKGNTVSGLGKPVVTPPLDLENQTEPSFCDLLSDGEGG